jgi:hypothetical protein
MQKASMQRLCSGSISANLGYPKRKKTETNLKFTSILKAEFLAENKVVAGAAIKRKSTTFVRDNE